VHEAGQNSGELSHSKYKTGKLAAPPESHHVWLISTNSRFQLKYARNMPRTRWFMHNEFTSVPPQAIENKASQKMRIAPQEACFSIDVLRVNVHDRFSSRVYGTMSRAEESEL
jgi:hypothetical protein